MKALTGVQQYRFEVGEEVVVSLADIGVFGVESGGALARARVPTWTIANVTSRVQRNGKVCYLLRFRHQDATCMCLVPQNAIDGTA